jgi:uncharacterized protein (TIGR00645 family)
MSLKALEKKFERFLFVSRWLLAPFYLGLMGGVVILLFKFFKELYTTFATLGQLSGSEVIISILTLVDICLIANLLIIIIFSGYESFVSKIELDGHEDRPEWMGKVGFAALKIKVIGSIVAISAIELLKVFVTVEKLYQDYPESQATMLIMWKVIIHVTFVISGVLFAVMDRTSSKK